MNTTEIAQSIDRRLQDAHGQIERLQGAKLALLNASKPDKPPARPRPTRQPRKPKVIPAGQLLKLVADNPGQTTTSLAKLAEADRNQVLSLLRDAEADRRVKRSGERRGTRWHLYTDEDKIQERAAELAANSRQSRARATQRYPSPSELDRPVPLRRRRSHEGMAPASSVCQTRAPVRRRRT